MAFNSNEFPNINRERDAFARWSSSEGESQRVSRNNASNNKDSRLPKRRVRILGRTVMPVADPRIKKPPR